MKHSHITDDLQEQASLYAAGAMTDTERLEYQRHLEDDQCAVCRAEVNELQAAASMLAFTAAPVVPSPAVRGRLMEQARSAASRTEYRSTIPFFRRSWTELIAVAAALGAMAFAFAAIRSGSELRQLNNELTSRVARLEVQLVRARTYISTMTSPEVRVVNLAGQGSNVQASGRLFWDKKQKRWFLYAKDLPPVPADKAYELWFVPKTGNPVKAVVFNTQADGLSEIEVDVPEGIDIAAAAVTIEPAGGTDQPTGPFALMGAM
jgi:anti-sigma-K factor RskA